MPPWGIIAVTAGLCLAVMIGMIGVAIAHHFSVGLNQIQHNRDGE